MSPLLTAAAAVHLAYASSIIGRSSLLFSQAARRLLLHLTKAYQNSYVVTSIIFIASIF